MGLSVTFTMNCEYGSPFSREKAHKVRDAVAMTLLMEKTFTAVITIICGDFVNSFMCHGLMDLVELLTSADPPFSDPSAPTNMSMKGNPVMDWVAAVISVILNSTATIIAKPRNPLNKVENQMLNGITFEASWISSARTFPSLVARSFPSRITHQCDRLHRCLLFLDESLCLTHSPQGYSPTNEETEVIHPTKNASPVESHPPRF